MHTRQEGIVRTWICRFYKRRNYITVFEWDTVENMRKALNKAGAPKRGYYDNALGATSSCVTVFTKNKWRCPKKFGEVHLVKDRYGSNIVAHELQHIINYWINFKEWNRTDDDEKIAMFAGVLHRMFWRGFYNRKENDIE